LTKREISAERQRHFFDDLKYSHQLAVLFPLACADAGLPPLAVTPYGALQRLRKVRNDVAHGTIRAGDLPDEDIHAGAAAASFAVVLAELVNQRFADEPSDLQAE
jgi:hypothetical protein